MNDKHLGLHSQTYASTAGATSTSAEAVRVEHGAAVLSRKAANTKVLLCDPELAAFLLFYYTCYVLSRSGGRLRGWWPCGGRRGMINHPCIPSQRRPSALALEMYN